MDVFKLKAALGLDSSEYEKGLTDAKGLASSMGSSIGNVLGGAAKAVGVAIGTATTAMGAFAVSSVNTGKDFDSSMSQVAATMGKTTDEIGELREFALEMGSTTSFSASQAADALNYMALAGYDADKSMEMLPNVLNLAAAGNMDLARASDMVTDAQTALGLSMDETTDLVDMMATASSKSNTSVEQLGDAILTIGGTAKSMAGGTLELTTSLGVLADNGIKGAEAGTHLRNVVLSLSSPTDKAATALEGLGVKTKDAEGNLLSIPAIMGQLGDSLDGLGTAERAEVISTIFNKTDIAAVNALLDTTDERWIELGDAIDDASGAAAKMADTQLDNLEGDVVKFKSALEGAQILVSDQLTPTLREFVKFGTSGVAEISDAFKEGGLSGAMEAFGRVLSEGLDMVIKMLPDFINAGMQLLGALGQGILDNLPTLIDATVQIATQISQGLMEAAPYLLDGAVQIIETLGNMLIENLSSMVSHITEMITGLAQMISDNADGIVSGAIQLITVLATSLLENLPTILGAVLDIVLAIAKALIDNAPQLLLSLAQILLKLGTAMAEWNLEILQKLGQFFLDIIKKFNEWDKNIKTAVATFFANLFSKLGEWIINTVSKVVSFFSDLNAKYTAWKEENTRKITTFFSDIINKVVTWFANLIDKFTNWINNTTGKATSFFSNIVNKVISWFSNLTSKVISFFSDTISKFASWISNMISKITTFVSDMGRKATEAATGFAKNLLDGVADLPSKFFEVGSNIVSGIWEGIKSGWDWLTDAVSDLASSLFDAAKDALGISSPSKKFMWIGEMSDRGMAEGLKKYSGLVDKAIEDITTVPEVNVNGANSGNGVANTATNNVVINVYGAVGQSVDELAEVISRKIDGATGRRMVAMGVG